jgi:hypothetical protein
MSELGAASGIVGIISFCLQIINGLLDYYGPWKDQDSDVANICTSLLFEFL